MIKYGFEDFDLLKINIKTESGNVKSANIPVRLGFIKRKVVEKENSFGELKEIYVFTLTKE